MWTSLTRSKADNIRVLSGETNFRDMFREMLASVKAPFEECKELLRQSELCVQRQASEDGGMDEE